MPYVYFISDGEYIKIGKSDRPWARLSSLQTGNPRPLTMRAVAPGGAGFEAGLHAAFEGANKRGEWFQETERLRRFVDAIADVFPDLQSPPTLRPGLSLKKHRQLRKVAVRTMKHLGAAPQIVEAAMDHAQNAGIEITVQNVVAKDGRPAGLLVLFGGLAYDDDEGIFALKGAPVIAAEPQPVAAD